MEDTGFLFDVKILSLLIKQFIVDKLDHKNLNVDVEFLKGTNVFDRKSHKGNLAINYNQDYPSRLNCTV